VREQGLPDALVAAGRWDAALVATGEALARDPADPRLAALMVRCLRALGRREEAVDAARRLLTLTPDDPYALRLAALVLLDVGWVDEAIGVSGRAVALDPASAASHVVSSRAWAASRRPEAQARQLGAAREAVLLDPHSVDAHVCIGVALAADGDTRAAREAYLQALRLDPGSSAALNNLAVLDLQAGTPDAAVRHLAAALAADPHDAVARRNLDVAAVRVLNRVAWWLVAAPIPALACAVLDWSAAARVLALGALVGLPLVLRGWWRALTAGQRRHLRSVRRRIRRITLAWPLAAALLGGVALGWVLANPDGVGPRALQAYVMVVLVVALMRLFAAMSRPSWTAQAAARAERWRTLTSRLRRRPGGR
jgi:Flp pilus assembly protein TadD